MDWKEINERRLAEVHPIFAERVRRFLTAMSVRGVAVLITSGFRSWEEQDQLYAKGRSVAGPRVTNARGGWSQHNFGFAIDVCPDDVNKDGLQLDWNDSHPVWKQMLEVALQFGLAEGAMWRSFPDKPHLYPVELDANPNETMRQLYKNSGGGKVGLDAVWDWYESILEKKAVTV